LRNITGRWCESCDHMFWSSRSFYAHSCQLRWPGQCHRCGKGGGEQQMSTDACNSRLLCKRLMLLNDRTRLNDNHSCCWVVVTTQIVFASKCSLCSENVSATAARGQNWRKVTEVVPRCRTMTSNT
jgi:hypothetical protein